jgi:SAM-dependent methyltransferase
MEKNYETIVKHYEGCLEKYGDTHRGVDWPKEEDMYTRYRVMLSLYDFDIRKPEIATLHDLGCGTGNLSVYMRKNGFNKLTYSGSDISEKFIKVCRQKFPELVFTACDVLTDPSKIGIHDYIVMNGVFTEKRELTYSEMLDYFKKMLSVIFPQCKRGMAFNVMSKHVDWEREDLFHLPLEELSTFLVKCVSRNFVIRNDYGLYEYTVYVYK